MKLVKILSDKVQIRSDYKEFDDARINDLIAVSDGEVELVTMVNTLRRKSEKTIIFWNIAVQRCWNAPLSEL